MFNFTKAFPNAANEINNKWLNQDIILKNFQVANNHVVVEALLKRVVALVVCWSVCYEYIKLLTFSLKIILLTKYY